MFQWAFDLFRNCLDKVQQLLLNEIQRLLMQFLYNLKIERMLLRGWLRNQGLKFDDYHTYRRYRRIDYNRLVNGIITGGICTLPIYYPVI